MEASRSPSITALSSDLHLDHRDQHDHHAQNGYNKVAVKVAVAPDGAQSAWYPEGAVRRECGAVGLRGAGRDWEVYQRSIGGYGVLLSRVTRSKSAIAF